MSQVFNQFGQIKQQPSDFERRSWPGDFPHENGNYTCNCCTCGKDFIGHKRRVVCRKCASHKEASA